MWANDRTLLTDWLKAPLTIKLEALVFMLNLLC